MGLAYLFKPLILFFIMSNSNFGKSRDYTIIGESDKFYISFNPLIALRLFEFKSGQKEFMDILNEGSEKILRDRGYSLGNPYGLRGEGRLLESIQTSKDDFRLALIPSRHEDFSNEWDYASFRDFFYKHLDAAEEQILFYTASGLDKSNPNLQNHRELITHLFDFWVNSATRDLSAKHL